MSLRFRPAAAGTTAALALALSWAAVGSASAAAPAARAAVADVPGWTAGATAVGPTAPAQVLHLSAVLALRQAGAAESLAAAVSDPASPRYRTFVTAAQWRAQFAPTPAQVKRVTGWLRAQGFTVTAVPANGRAIAFDGTAAQAEKAFGTQLRDYVAKGSRVTAPASRATLPRDIAAGVVGIAGLDTSARVRPSHVDPARDAGVSTAPQAALRRQAAPAATLPPPSAVFRNAPPCSAYYGEKPATGVPQILKDPLTYVPCGYKPGQVRSAYGVDAALSSGADGRGATVAVVDAFASSTIFADAQTYARRNDPRHPLRSYQFAQSLPATYRYTGPDECDAAGWYGEETLDVEAVHATAPAANILYVGASSCADADLTAAVNSVVDNELAQVVTNSYGEPELSADPASRQADHETALQAAAQGISLLFSSGDDNDYQAAATATTPARLRQASAPADDPLVTAVGGTSLAVGKNGQYLFEQGWGTGRSVLTNGAWDPARPALQYGGGGGTSRVFAQPGYQKGVVPAGIATIYGPARRAVPDVAMVGDPNTGFLVGQTQSFPDGSQRYSEYRIGGTSLSSPLLAGVVAVTNQVRGGSLGFLNPQLYKLVGSPAVHDPATRGVTDGVVRVDYKNGLDASGGTTTSLRTLNQTGSLQVRKGWDDVTGVGTPNGASFFTALAP